MAVDIGGTFTDVVAETAHARHTKKVLTTPRAPEEGVMQGVVGVLAEAGLSVNMSRNTSGKQTSVSAAAPY